MQAQQFDLNTYHDLVTQVYDSVTNPDCWSRSVIELARIYRDNEPDDNRLYGDICNIMGEELSPEMFAFLLPHIRKALSLCSRIEEVDHLQKASTQVLDRLSYGVVLLGDDAKPMVVNARARALCEQSGNLHLTPDALMASSIEESERLQEAIKAVVHHHASSALRLGEDQSLYLLLSPLESGNFTDQYDYVGARAAVFITAAKGESSFAANALKGMYGLSRAESRLVAALIKGFNVEEAARKLFVSKHTLRVQLRSVFKKTGARTQADLMRLLLSGPLTLQDVI